MKYVAVAVDGADVSFAHLAADLAYKVHSIAGWTAREAPRCLLEDHGSLQTRSERFRWWTKESRVVYELDPAKARALFERAVLGSDWTWESGLVRDPVALSDDGQGLWRIHSDPGVLEVPETNRRLVESVLSAGGSRVDGNWLRSMQ